MRPRRIVESFTLVAFGVYKAEFDFGYIARVWADDEELQAGTSQSLSSNQFFYDEDDGFLYVKIGGGTDPSLNIVTAAYELYLGTTDAHITRVPTDSASNPAYFEPLVKTSPIISLSISDNLFGFMPNQTASMTVSNATHFFDRHLYDSTFHQAELFLYHALKNLEPTNIKLIFSGTIGDLRYSNTEISFQVFSILDVLSSEFRHGLGQSFYGTDTFPNVDPYYSARPIRKVYGLVNGLIPVNIDYEINSPTTSDNRIFVVHGGQSNLGSVTQTVSVTPSSTVTRTYVNSTGFSVGDSVWLDRVSGTDEYVIVTNVDAGGTYIEHTSIASPMSSGDSVKRSLVGNVVIYQNATRFQPLYGRDYTETLLAGNTVGFTLANNFEATLGMLVFNPLNDRLFCRVYGPKNSVTINGNPVGTNDTKLGNLTNPVSITVDLLKRAGIRDSELDETSLVALAGTSVGAVGFSMPSDDTSDFPIYRDIVSKIMASILGSLIIRADNKIKISVIEPLNTEDIEIDDNEIERDSVRFSFDNRELISDVFVEYNFQETQDSSVKTGSTISRVYKTNEKTKYLYQTEKQRTFQAILIRESDADDLARRLSYIFGDRRGLIEFSTKNRFFETLPSDTVNFKSIRMPGFNYDGSTERSRLGFVTESSKGLRSVEIVIDDLKGVVDNYLTW
jgi:hypothetical protein